MCAPNGRISLEQLRGILCHWLRVCGCCQQAKMMEEEEWWMILRKKELIWGATPVDIFTGKLYLFLYLWDSKDAPEVETRRTYFCFSNDDVRHNPLLRSDPIKKERRKHLPPRTFLQPLMLGPLTLNNALRHSIL